MTPRPSARAARQFAASLLRAGLAASTVLGVIGHLKVGLRHLQMIDPEGELLLKDASDAVARLLPLEPAAQATPATSSHLRLLVRQDPKAGYVATLLWRSAARFSDWKYLAAADITPFPQGVFQIRYRRTKSQTRGVQRLAILSLPDWAADQMREDLSRGRPPLEGWTYATFRHRLRAVCPTLTPHSFRRGAVQVLLDGGVHPREVARLTGHKSLSTLYGYADRLPAPAWTAMEAARALLA